MLILSFTFFLRKAIDVVICCFVPQKVLSQGFYSKGVQVETRKKGKCFDQKMCDVQRCAEMYSDYNPPENCDYSSTAIMKNFFFAITGDYASTSGGKKNAVTAVTQ